MHNEKNELSDDDWKRKLSAEEFDILRKKGTEKQFSGEYLKNHKNGVYHCRACGAPLFSSDAKFDSGSGWPSFTSPISEESVKLQRDKSLITERTEIICAQCGSHQGHVFDDGPAPRGLRFCTNSLGLKFEEKE